MFARLKLPPNPAIKKKVFEFVITGKIADWITNKLGFSMTGTTLPLPFIVCIFYLCGDKMTSTDFKLVRAHEWTHAMQAQENHFFFIWWAKYLWQNIVQLIKYRSLSAMYYHNSFEVAAYLVQDNIMSGQAPYPSWDE